MFARARFWLWVAAVGGVVAALVTTSALAGSNLVAPSRLSDDVYAKAISQFVPGECSTRITPSRITVGSTGTFFSDLLLGGPSSSTMQGSWGNDCIVGGDGWDYLQGGSGTDVCIGGPGFDFFDSTCEFQIQ